MKIFSSLLLIIFISCSTSNQNDKKINKQNINLEGEKHEEIIYDFEDPKNFTFEDIAKYTIASIVFQSESKINVRKKGEIFYLDYTKDGKKNTFKVKFEKNRILWGNNDGRWRDNPLDEKIFFEETGKNLIIRQIWSDGSISEEKFIK